MEGLAAPVGDHAPCTLHTPRQVGRQAGRGVMVSCAAWWEAWWGHHSTGTITPHHSPDSPLLRSYPTAPLTPLLYGPTCTTVLPHLSLAMYPDPHSSALDPLGLPV